MTAAVDTRMDLGALPKPSAGVGSRRRQSGRQGLLMERAIKLRDQVPGVRRRSETRPAHCWAQIAVGLLTVGVGLAILYSTGPVWNWEGAMAVGLGPAVAMLGVIDLARRGTQGERRLEWILGAIRIGGVVVTTLLVVLEVITALIAVALLATAVIWGSWSNEVRYFLVNALVFAVMASGITMMVRVADLRTISLMRANWWCELGTFRQLTNIAVPVAVVGAAVALSLRDTRAVTVAMVGLATVLIGWARSDRGSTDQAVRRLAEEADALAAAVRPILTAAEMTTPRRATSSQRHAVVDALDRLELACHRNLRHGLPARPRYLVDVELILVVRACRAAFVDPPIEHLGSPLTTSVSRELTAMEPDQLARELSIFAADIRRLATLAPDRLVVLGRPTGGCHKTP